ncbi:MAG TPA: response regulator transcription factor [Planctomycetota bacterium]|nr:response regulator transcription factor [Planctomycetota bacterium]
MRPANAARTRVLIVDDHAVVRLGITARLEIEPDLEVCGHAATTTEAKRHIEHLRPDVVILDLSLEAGSGLDLLKDLQAHGDKTRVLVVSGLDEAIYADRCVRAGASGFLSKTEAVDRIVEGIRCVHNGGFWFSEAVTNQIMAHLSSRKPDSGDPMRSLSDRELQVYEAIGAGLSVKQIAARLFLSPKTVDTYRSKLKQKLGLDNSQQLARHAVRWALDQTR